MQTGYLFVFYRFFNGYGKRKKLKYTICEICKNQPKQTLTTGTGKDPKLHRVTAEAP
jgi:hypothetical protein